MTQLKISRELSLPIDAATQTFAFIARKGAGKTYTAGKLVELLLEAKVQVVVLDTVGNWYGIRMGADGKSAGFDVAVLGGLRGDIPLEPTKGALIADIVVETGRSMVLDLSQWSKADRQRFAAAFGERLWLSKKAERHPIPVHLVLEESQLIVPQDVRGDTATMVGVYEEIIRLGRNYGIGVSMISQRPQSVNKEVLNQTECLFVGQVNGAQEREALKKWISHQGMDVHLVDELPSLKVGTFYVWSPQWLNVLQKVQILPKHTLDASATPKVGDTRVRRELKPLDLTDLKAKMAETIEKAKADDPKELRKKILQLEKQVRDMSNAKPLPAVVDQSVIDRAVNKALSNVYDRHRSAAAHVRRALARMNAIATEITELADPAIARLDVSFIEQQGLNANDAKAGALLAPIERRRNPSTSVVSQSVQRAERRSVGHAGGDSRERPAPSNLKTGQKKILNALAEFEMIGVDQTTRHQLGMMAGYNLTGGSGAQHIADLKGMGLVEIPVDGYVRLTDEGRSQADAAAAPTTLDELHERVLRKLSAGQRKIAEHLISIYPDSISRAELGEAVGYNLTGGSGAQHVADLITVGAAKVPAKGAVVASDLLFPEALN